MRLFRLFASPAGRGFRWVAGLLLTIGGLLSPTNAPLGFLLIAGGLLPLVAAIDDVRPRALLLRHAIRGDDIQAHSR